MSATRAFPFLREPARGRRTERPRTRSIRARRSTRAPPRRRGRSPVRVPCHPRPPRPRTRTLRRGPPRRLPDRRRRRRTRRCPRRVPRPRWSLRRSSRGDDADREVGHPSGDHRLKERPTQEAGEVGEHPEGDRGGKHAERTSPRPFVVSPGRHGGHDAGDHGESEQGRGRRASRQSDGHHRRPRPTDCPVSLVEGTTFRTTSVLKDRSLA